MEIHKPKPVHNWRELLTEVGVIVVGIVIPLTAEQMLQGLESRERVTRAEGQMRLEMARDDGPVVFQRLAIEGCIDSNLSQIRTAVERRDSRVAVLEAVAQFDVPRHTWDSVSYQAANSSGVLSRLAPERLDQWSFLYAMMPALDRADEREFRDAGQLHAISRLGGGLSEAEQLRLLEAVENLERDNSEMHKLVTQARDALKSLGIALAKDGQRRVVDELSHTSGNDACLTKLKTMMGYAN